MFLTYKKYLVHYSDYTGLCSVFDSPKRIDSYGPEILQVKSKREPASFQAKTKLILCGFQQESLNRESYKNMVLDILRINTEIVQIKLNLKKTIFLSNFYCCQQSLIAVSLNAPSCSWTSDAFCTQKRQKQSRLDKTTSLISGLSSEAEIHKNPFMAGSGRSSRGRLWTGARVSGVLKQDCEITNPFFWSLQPESSKWDPPTLLRSQKKGQTLTNKRVNLTNRCRSSPSQHWHQRRQNTSINSSLPVTSVSPGIISHCHIHYRHAGRCERECISLWELTDSVFTGFIYTEGILWMRSEAKRPSEVVSAVRPAAGP